MRLVYKLKEYYRTAYFTNHFPSVFQLLFSRNKVLAYYGFLGDKNFGDELVLESARELFFPTILFPIRKRMPISHLLYVKMFSYRISGLVVGGGTLIGNKFWDVTFYKELVKTGKPVYVHGTGVHKIDLYNEAWKEVLGKKLFGGVRGPLSKKNLEYINVSTNTVGDAAFALLKAEYWPVSNKKGKTVLINLGAHLNYRGETSCRNELKKFLEFLIKNEFSVQFLPFHHIDVKHGLELKSMYPQISLLSVPERYVDGIRHFRNCTFAVGERLHFNIMAVLVGCPFLSINYGPKHEDFLASLGLSKVGCKPEELTLDKLALAFRNRNSFDWDGTFKKIKYFKDVQFEERTRFMSNLT